MSWAVGTLQVAALLLCCLAAVASGLSRGASAVTLILIVCLDTLAKSAGAYANHAQVLPLLLLILCCALDTKENDDDDLLVASTGIIATLYSYIGFSRIITGGPEMFVGSAIVDDVSILAQQYASYDFRYGLMLSSSAVGVMFLKLGFVAVTILECLSGLLVVSQRFTVIWGALMVVFHFLTLLTMNIWFWENQVLIAVLLLPGVTGLGFKRHCKGVAAD
jgi:hypothetical protein